MFDLKRARELMVIKNVDAVIVSSPVNFYYVSGFQSYGGRGARGGRYTAILPKEENQEPALVNIDWECEKLRSRTWTQVSSAKWPIVRPRPASEAPRACFDQLDARLGVEGVETDKGAT